MQLLSAEQLLSLGEGNDHPFGIWLQVNIKVTFIQVIQVIA